jgi:hypothetical protein
MCDPLTELGLPEQVPDPQGVRDGDGGTGELAKSRQPRTIPVNFRAKKCIPPCTFSHSRAINNEPRAIVWLAGRIFLQLSCASGI